MTAGFRLLNGGEITTLLGELLDRLASRGVEVETYIIGGAAMAIHLGREELTPDVDGIFRPEKEVSAEAAAMAVEYNLAPNWVNSAAFSFITFDPADDKDAVRVELRGHTIVVASKRVLLAMKIAASRTKDRADLNRLITDLGISDADEIVDLAFAVFGEYSMSLGESRDEVRLVAEEALARAAVYQRQMSDAAAQPSISGAVLSQGRVDAGQPGAGQWTEKSQSPPEVELHADL